MQKNMLQHCVMKTTFNEISDKANIVDKKINKRS